MVEKQISQFSEPVHNQLLERISSGAVELSSNQYSDIRFAGHNNEQIDLNQQTADVLFNAVVPGGHLSGLNSANNLPLMLAGFVHKDNNTFSKPAGSSQTVSLSRPNKKSSSSSSSSTSSSSVQVPRFKRAAPQQTASIVQLDLGDDDDLIDENDLIMDDSTELSAAIILPAKCDPGPGKKRRKACKDCTCGLKELEEQEVDNHQQKQAAVVSLSTDDIAEVDFTVPGKAVGGCGSCALGDAFRCDGCPYLGLPPFRPGEVVSIAGLRGDDL